MKKEDIRALVFFIIIMLFMVGPHLYPPTRVGTTGRFPFDANIFRWNFWWTNKALSGFQNPYWTDLLYHPDGTSLAYHIYPFVYSVISIPFQHILPGLKGLSLAFNCIVFLSFVVGGWGAYLLAKHITRSTSGALLAGLIFTLIPYHFRNMVRMHEMAIEFIPFYILALLKLHEEPNMRRSLALGGVLALCFYSSLGYALFLIAFSAIWLSYQLIVHHYTIDRRFLIYLVLAAVVFAIIASPLLHQQMLARREGGVNINRPIQETVDYTPALLAMITPSRLHPVYGDSLAFLGKWGDKKTWGMRSEASVGIVALFLAILAIIWNRRSKKRIFWAISALIFFILCLGPYLRLTGTKLTEFPMPYLLLYKLLPPLQAGRNPITFLPLLMLSMAILAAFAVRSLRERLDRRHLRLLLISVLVLLVLFENLEKWPHWQLPEPNSFYQKLAQTPGDFAIIDMTFPFYAVIAQTIHGKKINSCPFIVPRSAASVRLTQIEKIFQFPEDILKLDPSERALRVEEINAEIRMLKIGYVVLPNEPHSANRVEVAKYLGARVSEEDELIVCMFQDNFPAQTLQGQ